MENSILIPLATAFAAIAIFVTLIILREDIGGAPLVIATITMVFLAVVLVIAAVTWDPGQLDSPEEQALQGQGLYIKDASGYWRPAN